MIRLKRPNAPACLSREKIETETALFKATGKAVWDIAELRDALEEIAFSKCCYCETPLGTRGAIMEVEHFKPKNKYPDDVLTWSNLLPACRRCNAKKGDLDVVTDPIIDPTEMEPREHLRLDNYFFRFKTQAGQNTIEHFGFNYDSDFMKDRYSLVVQIMSTLHEIRSDLVTAVDLRAFRKIGRRTKQILKRAQPNQAFAATASTAILGNEDLSALMTFLKEKDLWDNELETLSRTASELALA